LALGIACQIVYLGDCDSVHRPIDVRKQLSTSWIFVTDRRCKARGIDRKNKELTFPAKELVGYPRDLFFIGAVNEAFGRERFSSIGVRAGRIPVVLRNKVVNGAHGFVRLLVLCQSSTAGLTGGPG